MSVNNQKLAAGPQAQVSRTGSGSILGLCFAMSTTEASFLLPKTGLCTFRKSCAGLKAKLLNRF